MSQVRAASNHAAGHQRHLMGQNAAAVKTPRKHQGIFLLLAEGVGFEPTIRFPVYTLSKRAPSATRPSLREFAHYNDGTCADNLRVNTATRY